MKSNDHHKPSESNCDGDVAALKAELENCQALRLQQVQEFEKAINELKQLHSANIESIAVASKSNEFWGPKPVSAYNSIKSLERLLKNESELRVQQEKQNEEQKAKLQKEQAKFKTERATHQKIEKDLLTLKKAIDQWNKRSWVKRAFHKLRVSQVLKTTSSKVKK